MTISWFCYKCQKGESYEDNEITSETLADHFLNSPRKDRHNRFLYNTDGSAHEVYVLRDAPIPKIISQS